jgi:hypothetical protein
MQSELVECVIKVETRVKIERKLLKLVSQKKYLLYYMLCYCSLHRLLLKRVLVHILYREN